MKVQFKHEYWGEGWQDFTENVFDEEHAAEKIAESSYRDDPCDPSNFDFTIEIKSERGIKRFNISAQADVNFYAKEIKP